MTLGCFRDHSIKNYAREIKGYGAASPKTLPGSYYIPLNFTENTKLSRETVPGSVSKVVVGYVVWAIEKNFERSSYQIRAPRTPAYWTRVWIYLAENPCYVQRQLHCAIESDPRLINLTNRPANLTNDLSYTA